MARIVFRLRVAGFLGVLAVIGEACAGPRNTARSDAPPVPMETTPPPPPPESRPEPVRTSSGEPGPPMELETVLGPGDLVPPPEGRARAKRSPVLGETAFLFIEAEPPSARIFVDGVRVGEGQAFLRVRGPRWKVLRVEASGYEPIEGAVAVREGEVVKVRLVLDPIGGRLTVVTDRPGVEVLLDGRPVGTAPLTLKRVMSGVHHLVLRAGSWRWSGDVEVRTGETRLIETTVGSVVAAPPPVTPVQEPASTPEEPARAGPVTREPSPSSSTPPAVEKPAASSPTPAAESPAPSPQPAAAPSGRPDCDAICTRFVQAVSGSESIREPVFNRCRDRCRSGDLRFSVCAWKARDMGDVTACMNLPE